jgi:hypothetical protein
MAKKNPAKTKWLKNPDFKAPKAPSAAPQPDAETEPDNEPDAGAGTGAPDNTPEP